MSILNREINIKYKHAACSHKKPWIYVDVSLPLYLLKHFCDFFIYSKINLFRLYIESEEKLILLHLEKELLVKMEQ